METASAFGLNRPAQNGRFVAAASVPASADARWMSLLRLVAAEYPYAAMHGVHIMDGCIVACEGLQRSFAFGCSQGAAAAKDETFEAHWKALRSLCAKMGSGRLAELRFSDGKPVSARTSESGRRFKRILGQDQAERQQRTPMN